MLGYPAMDVQTKEETPLADVVTALSAQAALTTRDRRPHGDDFPEKVGVGVRPNGQNTPTNLVTENERRHTHPRGVEDRTGRLRIPGQRRQRRDRQFRLVDVI